MKRKEHSRQKGLSYVEPGRKYHMDLRTAKRYVGSPQKPEYTLSEPKPTRMDPCKQILDERLRETPYSALRILEKLREMGFDGSCSIVKAYVSSRKMDLDLDEKRKDMVVNPQHDRRLTLKQTMDTENVLPEQRKGIDVPLKPSDLSRYDEVLYVVNLPWTGFGKTWKALR